MAASWSIGNNLALSCYRLQGSSLFSMTSPLKNLAISDSISAILQVLPLSFFAAAALANDFYRTDLGFPLLLNPIKNRKCNIFV